MSISLPVDTSFAVAPVVQTHAAHAAVVHCAGRDVALSGHASAETYSVPTRRLPGVPSRMEIADASLYDALVASAAVNHKVDLPTPDARARDTYDKVGARVVIAG